MNNDLQLVRQTIQESRELRTLLEHPLVRIDDKKQIVKQLFEARVQPMTFNFLFLLLDKRRIKALDAISVRFHQMVAALKRQVGVTLTTAVDMGQAEIDALRQDLARQWNREVVMEAKVDPEILGGAVLQIGDQVVDGSIRARLDALKATLVR
ncbi:ATP synthase subunit delta [compost metagenome]